MSDPRQFFPGRSPDKSQVKADKKLEIKKKIFLDDASSKSAKRRLGVRN